jgi:glycosyltransferase involved in cell wall biosynthesis
MTSEPFVSVVTPVYNGGKFIRECIESVLGQTHRNFEYVILDNASTDDTNAIVAAFAAQDSRVRVHRNQRTLPMIENWNRSMKLASSEAAYVKILHADDAMYPECLAKMVALAQANPKMGMVGTLRLRGDRGVECGGLARGSGVYPGREVARLYLRREVFSFAPTGGLIRGDIVRGRRPFYPKDYLHSDLAAYFELLHRYDYGHVDEVLQFSRVHPGSVSATIAIRKQTLMAEWLPMLRAYGSHYFTADELSEVERQFIKRYHRLLVRRFVARDRAFLDYHLPRLRTEKLMPGTLDVVRAVAAEAVASIAQPARVYREIRGQRSATA